jgi:transketolase
MTSSILGSFHSALDHFRSTHLRLLAVDTVQKANSGHPGAPLGCAPIAYLLFHKLMKHNPGHWKWADRDRFVLSNGHAPRFALFHAVSIRLQACRSTI